MTLKLTQNISNLACTIQQQRVQLRQETEKEIFAKISTVNDVWFTVVKMFKARFVFKALIKFVNNTDFRGIKQQLLSYKAVM